MGLMSSERRVSSRAARFVPVNTCGDSSADFPVAIFEGETALTFASLRERWPPMVLLAPMAPMARRGNEQLRYDQIPMSARIGTEPNGLVYRSLVLNIYDHMIY